MIALVDRLFTYFKFALPFATRGLLRLYRVNNRSRAPVSPERSLSLNDSLNGRLCLRRLYLRLMSGDGFEESEFGNVGRSLRDFKTTTEIFASGNDKVIGERRW